VTVTHKLLDDHLSELVLVQRDHGIAGEIARGREGEGSKKQVGWAEGRQRGRGTEG
jgi:hypothetical protein